MAIKKLDESFIMRFFLLVALLASLHTNCMGMFVAKKLRHVKMSPKYSRFTNTNITYTTQWLVENGFDSPNEIRMDKIKRYSNFGNDFETWYEIIQITPIDVAFEQKNIPILRSLILENNNYNLDQWLKNNGFNNPHDERDVVVRTHSSCGQDSPTHEEKTSLSPIHLAIIQKNVPVILSLLVIETVDVEIKNGIGQTVLMAIFESCNSKEMTWSYKDATTKNVIELLIALGANVNAKNSLTKKTVLHVAAAGGPHAAKFVHMLLEQEAEVNAQDITDRTPLHDAAESFDSIETIKILTHFGARPDMRCRELFYGGNMTPHDVAIRAMWKHSSARYKNAPTILGLLKSNNSDQNAGYE